MDPNIAVYKEYTKWLNTLPGAIETGECTRVGSGCIELIFTITGYDEVLFILGSTNFETDQSVIASLPQGALLKARVFEPTKLVK